MNNIVQSRRFRSSGLVSLLGAIALAGTTSLAGCKPKEQPAPPEPVAQPEPEAEPEPVAKAPARVYPDPPPPSSPKAFDFPDVAKFELDNGLVVYVVNNPEVPLVSAQLVVRAGEMDAEYVADFTASMLGEGTKSRSKAQIDEAIEFVGGSLGAGSGIHATYVFSRILEKDLKLALTLLADELMNPTFPPEALEKLKAQAKTALKAAKADPAALAQTLFDQVVYPEGHPYGRPWPKEETIEQITIEDLQKFHETFYKANNAFLVLAGDIDAKKAEPLVQRAFKRWDSTTAEELPPNPLNKFKNYEPAKKLVIHLVNRPASAQTEILVGNLALTRNHEEWTELQVANTVLGDDASGRLFQDVREEKGLTYGIYSRVSEGQAPGTFYVATQTRTKTTGEMLAEIFEHLEDFHDNGPTEEEVIIARDKMIGNFALEIETPGQIAAKMREILIYNLPPSYWTDYRDELATITTQDVQQAAKRYIHPMPHVVLVGKADDIEAQLGKILPDAEIIRYNEDLERQ